MVSVDGRRCTSRARAGSRPSRMPRPTTSSSDISTRAGTDSANLPGADRNARTRRWAMTTVTWRIPGLVAMLAAMTGARVSPPPFLSEPEMIGPGVISTADDEYAGSLTPDGNTIYYNKSVPAHNAVHRRRLAPGERQVVDTVIAPWSGRYSDTDPEVSPDGRTIYFASDRPVGNVIRHDYDIWKVELQPDGSGPHRFISPRRSTATPTNTWRRVTSDGAIYVSSFSGRSHHGHGRHLSCSARKAAPTRPRRT